MGVYSLVSEDGVFHDLLDDDVDVSVAEGFSQSRQRHLSLEGVAQALRAAKMVSGR